MVETAQERTHRDVDERAALAESDYPQRPGVTYCVDQRCSIVDLAGKTQYLTLGSEITVARGEERTWIGEPRLMSSEVATADFDALVAAGNLSIYEE